MLRLDARLNSDLKWDFKPKTDRPIFWYLDFGFHEALPSFRQNGLLSSYLIAIEQFVEQCWKPYSSETIGVYLFRGTLNQTCQMKWDLDFEEDYLKWKEELPCLNDLRSH